MLRRKRHQSCFDIVANPLHQFFCENLPALLIEPDGRQCLDGPTPTAVLAGSFNPLHAGHLGLAEMAARILNTPVVFEICICNVDKPPLNPDDVSARLRQFAWHYPVWLTRAPTFVEKARLFPGATFVVGADTAERIIAPRYYSQGETGLNLALNTLREQGCRILVACRRTPGGTFCRLPDLDIPAAFPDLFQEIPETVFQMELSSTQLRQPTSSQYGREEEKNAP